VHNGKVPGPFLDSDNRQQCYKQGWKKTMANLADAAIVSRNDDQKRAVEDCDRAWQSTKGWDHWRSTESMLPALLGAGDAGGRNKGWEEGEEIETSSAKLKVSCCCSLILAIFSFSPALHLLCLCGLELCSPFYLSAPLSQSLSPVRLCITPYPLSSPPYCLDDLFHRDQIPTAVYFLSSLLP
jgi:hypothetical protein